MLRRIFCKLVLAAVCLLPSWAMASGFIDTPDQCYAIEKLVGVEVHLRPVGTCAGTPGRVFVEAKPGEIRKVYIDGLSKGNRVVKSLEVVDVTGLMDKAESLKKGMKVAKNVHADAMKEAAQQVKDVYDSPEFQQQVQYQMERIQEAYGGQSSYYSDARPVPKSALSQDERVYIFVSSSMPIETIRNYVIAVDRLKEKNISVVFRGFVGGMSKIGPTVNYMGEALKVDSMCRLTDGCKMMKVNVIVDPLLYKRFNVERVPSFVYLKGLKHNNPGMSEGYAPNIDASGDFYKLEGDGSLKYVLGIFGRAAGAGSLESLSRKL